MINFSIWLRFDQLIEYGQKMLASNPRVKQVKDRLTALKQEKAALKNTWFERNDLLNESQDLQVSFSWSFSKDAQWQDTQSCLGIDPKWKEEKRPVKNHPTAYNDERGREVGSNRGLNAGQSLGQGSVGKFDCGLMSQPGWWG